jgi:hypothetical protein
MKNGAAASFPELLRVVTRQYNETEHSVLRMAPWTVWTGRPPPEVRAPLLLAEGKGDRCRRGRGRGRCEGKKASRRLRQDGRIPINTRPTSSHRDP